MKDILVQIMVQEHNNEFFTYGMLLIPKSKCTVIKTVEHVQQLERPVTIVFTEITSFARVDTTIKNLNTFIDYQEQQIKDLQAQLNTYEIEDSVTMKHVQPEVLGDIKGLHDILQSMDTPEPKLIAKKGEFVKLVSSTCENLIIYNTPYELMADYFENGSVPLGMNGWYSSDYIKNHNMKFEKCSAPAPQRRPLGMYDGLETCNYTKAWFVDFNTLKIMEGSLSKGSYINVADKDGVYYSRFYLTPKEANARLKEEVTKKAKQRTFTFDELEIYNNKWMECITPLGYAIELIEKEYGVTYLPE